MDGEKPTLPLQYSVRPPRLNLRRPPLLILLHGFGSNDYEFLKIAEHFDERFVVLSARAPFSQTAGSSNWFSVDWSHGAAISNGVQAEYSRNLVVNLIQQAIQAFQCAPAQVYLFGHSQGAAIGLMCMLSRPDLLAGLIAINGQILPEVRHTLASIEKLKAKQMLLIHGIQDVFYPISLGRAASALLATMPVEFEYFEYHMGHSLTPQCITKSQEWLSKHLDAQGVFGLPEKASYTPQLSSIYLKVKNIERSISFYVRFLGMRLEERVGKAYAFLSNNASHDMIVLQNAGNDAHDPAPEATGLAKICFTVPDQATLARAVRTLQEAKIEFIAVDHLISWGVRFQDPDGHEIELIWDNRGQPGRSNLWQGRDLPLEVEKILSIEGN